MKPTDMKKLREQNYIRALSAHIIEVNTDLTEPDIVAIDREIAATVADVFRDSEVDPQLIRVKVSHAISRVLAMLLVSRKEHHEQGTQNLSHLVHAENGEQVLAQLDTLLQQDFLFDARDVGHLYHLGNMYREVQRQTVGNRAHYDYSTEAKTFLLYCYHQMRQTGVREETLWQFLDYMKKVVDYNRNNPNTSFPKDIKMIGENIGQGQDGEVVRRIMDNSRYLFNTVEQTYRSQDDENELRNNLFYATGLAKHFLAF